MKPHSDLTDLPGPVLVPLMLLRAIMATIFPTDDSAVLESKAHNFPPGALSTQTATLTLNKVLANFLDIPQSSSVLRL